MSPRYSDQLQDYGPDRKVFGFGLRWILAGIVLAVVVGLILVPVALGMGWIGAGAKVISPDNVSAQFQQAYDDINALNAVASNICTLEKARDGEAKGSDAYNTYEAGVIAQEQNYQRIENHYNAYVSDPFRAKIVRPRDLPAVAPTEAQSLTAIGCITG